jgi:hypothetical protein
VTITSSSCTFTHVIGFDFYNYDIVVNYTATGPVGAQLQLMSHIFATSGGYNCTSSPCSGSWTGPANNGSCERGPNDPATTSGTWCFSASCTVQPCNYSGADVDMVDSLMYLIATDSTGSLICQ